MDELSKCRCYFILGGGYAYWNTETKELFEFDQHGELVGNSEVPKFHTNNMCGDRVCIMLIEGSTTMPQFDYLGLKQRFQNMSNY